MTTPEISVIIPTNRPPQILAPCLLALAAQSMSRERFEVLVINDGAPHDLTLLAHEMRARGLNIRVLTVPQGGPARSRNHGAAAATGDVLVFTDDDCVPEPDGWRRSPMRPVRIPTRCWAGTCSTSRITGTPRKPANCWSNSSISTTTAIPSMRASSLPTTSRRNVTCSWGMADSIRPSRGVRAKTGTCAAAGANVEVDWYSFRRPESCVRAQPSAVLATALSLRQGRRDVLGVAAAAHRFHARGGTPGLLSRPAALSTATPAAAECGGVGVVDHAEPDSQRTGIRCGGATVTKNPRSNNRAMSLW